MERQKDTSCHETSQIMLKAYDWLLFDLDNTVLDWGASSVIAFHKMMEEKGHKSDQNDYLQFREINVQVWKEMEEGLINHQQLKSKRWSMYFDAKNINEDPAKANETYFEHIKDNPVFVESAKEVLKFCRDHFNQMIITNGLSEVQRPRIQKTGLDQYFDHIVISDELGHAKPNKEYFQHCHQLIDFHQKDRVLVIGDNLLSDIKGGKDYGFDTCWYNYYQTVNETSSTDYEIKSLDKLRDVLFF